MKILLLGDASNYYASLVPAIMAQGHSVTLASDGGAWMATMRHIDLSRSPSPLGGARLYWRLLHQNELSRGYDAVFLCDTSFVKLRPARQTEVFNRLRRRNGKIFLTALGTNSLYVSNLTGPNPALPFSEFQSPWGAANKHAWLTREQLDYSRYLYENVDGIVSALYEYHVVAQAEVPGQKIVYAGIATPPVEQLHRPQSDAVRIVAAFHPGREAEKGMDVLLPMIYRLMREYPQPIQLTSASGIPFDEFRRRIAMADVVVDQYYAMSPATTALMAMGAGAVPVTGGHPDWLRFIGAQSAPLVATDPRDPELTYQNIRSAMDSLDALQARTKAFAALNDPGIVAARMLSILD